MYLTRGNAQIFIPLMRFLLQSLFLRSFLVHLKYSFLIFSFIFTYLMQSAFSIPSYLQFSFSPSIMILSSYGSSIPSTVSYFILLFIMSMAHSLIPNSIPIFWLYILVICISISSTFSFFVNTFISYIYVRLLNFSCGFVNL